MTPIVLSKCDDPDPNALSALQFALDVLKTLSLGDEDAGTGEVAKTQESGAKFV